MKDLKTCREEIDEIDQQIIALFEQRMHVVKDVIEYKKQHLLPIFQSEREKVVIEKNIQRLTDESLKKYAYDFILNVMNVSKAYQRSLLNDNKNIVLIGIMGSGKTTLSKMLGELLNKEVVDMDDYLVERFNMSIEDMFKISEEYFRDKESICCKELSIKENCIIASGGGIITRKENIDALRKNALIIYIDRPVDHIIKDINILSRPLLKEGPQKLYELYEQRHQLYIDACDVHLINDSSKEEIIKKIMEVM